MPRYIKLAETASTNTYMARSAQMLPSGTVIFTPRQSEGRGQRGNSWESEPDKNITFSMLIKDPGVPPMQQFYLSEAVSMAVVDTLSEFVDGITVKWPNDIYHGDKKICGILIEHALRSNRIAHTIAGVGININQRQFISDAPNPVSLVQAAEAPTDFDTTAILHSVCERIERYCAQISNAEPQATHALHQRYLSRLYRCDGKMHPFTLPDGTAFMAKILDVLPQGPLVLLHDDGSTHQYVFKEVAFQLT